MRAMRAAGSGRQHRLSRQKGVTALEYGILAAVVVILIGAIVFTNLTTVLTNVFSNVTSAATTAISH
ncbi:Flp family type IVb pilin [Pandoraea terrigena]|uniref:Pilus assembly protein n=1 Tax=Pandoraea terrigena TaxID=2508292 RepID=A0A5E4VB73_9BURK|nr:Flp family type IVb pilin [Pandoraea terrigena]VVE08295.1 pilus assembly protein [Pandoraea terrigena]